jgi:hypothetical protein
VSYNKVRTREGGNIPLASVQPTVLAARRLVEKCLNILLAVMCEHTKIMENLGGNYHSRVLVLLDFETRVIVPQRSAQSLSVLCHGHSPCYISQSLNKYVTLSLK